MNFEIKSQTEYDSALKRIDELWDAQSDTKEGAEFDALFEAVERFEEEHFPMEEPDSYGAVEYHLDRLNLSIEKLAIDDNEKAILQECIAKELLVPEWLLVKLSSVMNIPRDLLGRAEASQATVYSHNRMQ
jgi:HTH-type transcriptional regulator/antitoxin HigA